MSEKWLLSPRLHFEFLQLLPRWYSAKSPQLSRKLRSSMLKQSCHTEYAKRKFDISFLKRGSVLKYNFYKYIKVIKMITLQRNIKKFELFLSKISTSFQFHFFYSILSIIRSINIFSNSWDIQFIYKSSNYIYINKLNKMSLVQTLCVLFRYCLIQTLFCSLCVLFKYCVLFNYNVLWASCNNIYHTRNWTQYT